MIDLHLHTNKSDGEHSPSKVVEIAKLSGVSTIAITDHDTCSGVSEAIYKGSELDVQVIPGIEVTAYENEEVHVLGYNVDYTSKKLDDYFELVQNKLKNEENIIFETLNKYGLTICREEIVEKYSKGEMITPTHFIDWIIDNGSGKSRKEIYIEYFQKGELRHRKSDRMSIKEAIDFIKSLGGIAVLAHPSRISWNAKELLKNVRELKEYGLVGIEAIYSLSTNKQIKEHMKLAKDNNLLVTLGSDYHGHKVKDYIDIGFGMKESLLKYQRDNILENILESILSNNNILL